MAEELNAESIPMSDLSAFDTTSSYVPGAELKKFDAYQNVVGNPVTGSNPQSKLQAFDTTSVVANLENAAIQSIASYENPYERMRPYTYNGDYDGANFERYHSTDQYKTLGFSPYRDNESLYNNNMTMGDQFARAASQWDNLVTTGFKSGIKSWGTLFTDPLAPDMESADAMKRAMAIGSSSTGGLAGFATNTFLNSGFTIGIAADFVAEEIGLAAITAFTGGLTSEVTVPGMMAKAGMATRRLAGFGAAAAETAKALNKGAEIERLAKAGKQGNEALNTLRNGLNSVSDMQSFWNTIPGKVAKGAFDIVNPLDNTVKALKATDYASGLAKTAKTFGGFVDDVIQIKGAVSESVLEGGMTKLDVTEKLIDNYRKANFGQDPEGEELTKIENIASEEAHRVALYNLPAISISNKFLYATMVAPISKLIGRGTSNSLNSIIFKKPLKGVSSDAPFEVLGKGLKAQATAAVKSLASPKLYGKYGMDYLKANFAEGIQENLQDAISTGAVEHALSTYTDPTKAAYEGYMGYFMAGLNDQFSARGAETFAGGLAMGMFAQPVMGSASWTINKLSQLTNRAEIAAFNANKEAQDQRDADALNALYKDDLRFFSPDLKNSITQQGLAKDFHTAVQNGDEKEARDAQFNAIQSHLSTAIRTGKLDIFLDKLSKYKDLDAKSAMEAFSKYGITTEEDAIKAQGQIDGVIERAKKLRNKAENIGSEYPNPYNYQQYQAGTALHSATVKAAEAWEEAKQNLLYSESAFDDHADRVAKMASTFSGIANSIGKTDAQTLMRLLDPVDTEKELITLKQEIATLDPKLSEQKKLIKEKQKTFDLLSDYHNLVKATEKVTGSDKKIFAKGAKESFKKYINHVSGRNNTIVFDSAVNKAYQLILDSHTLKNEMQGLARSINVLSNPQGFLNTQERLYTAFQELDKEKIVKENQKPFGKITINNDLHNGIGKLGLKLPEEFMEVYQEAVKNKTEFPTPEYFIDPKTNEQVTEGENFDKAMKIWEAFVGVVPKDEEKKVVVKKEPIVNEEGNAEFSTFSPGLMRDLGDMFTKAMKEGLIPENDTIGNYIKTNAEAMLQIKLANTEANLNKAQEEKAEKPIVASAKIETAPHPEAVEQLNMMGYSNTQIKELTRDERTDILKNGIAAEDFYKGKTVAIGTKGTIKVDGKVITMEGVPGSIDFTDNQKDTNFDTMMPEITSLVKNWDKDFVNKNLVNYNGQFIFNYDGRVFVLVQVGKFIVPYYFSSSGTSGKAIDWHYVFGVDENNGWIIKGGVDDKGEMVYSKVFKERYPKTIAELEKIKKEIRTKLAMTTEQRDAVVGQLSTKNKELSKKYNKSLGSIYKDLDVVENRSSSGIEVNDNYNYLVNATLGLIGLDNIQPATSKGISTETSEAQKADIENKLGIDFTKFYWMGTGQTIDDILKGKNQGSDNSVSAKNVIGYDLGDGYFAIGMNGHSVDKSRPNNNKIEFKIFNKGNELFILSFTKTGSDIWTETDLNAIKKQLALKGGFISKLSAEDILQKVNIAKNKYDAELEALKVKPVETKNALKDVESTVKALNKVMYKTYNQPIWDFVTKSDTKTSPEIIAEAYHKAKKDGSNPELVKTVEDLLSKEQPAEEVKEAPLSPINDAYIGKIVYVTPGSNKEELAKNNIDVIDADDIILQTAQDINPNFKPETSLPVSKQIGRAIDAIGKKELYNKAYKNMRELANKGKTIITSSLALMKVSDMVMIQRNNDFIAKDYDFMKEITESNNVKKGTLTIAIEKNITDALTKTPEQLLGMAKAAATENIESQDLTVEDINKNINEQTLGIAKEKGFDAVYKNERYAIVKINKKTVSLKPVSGNPISVNIEDITSVVSAEQVPVTKEEIDLFAANQETIKEGDLEVDETVKSLSSSLNNIVKKVCP